MVSYYKYYKDAIKTDLHWCKKLDECADNWFHWCTIVHQTPANLKAAAQCEINQYLKRTTPLYKFGIGHNYWLPVSTLLQAVYAQTWFMAPTLELLIKLENHDEEE